MKSTLMHLVPTADLSTALRAAEYWTAPVAAGQGTRVPFAATSLAAPAVAVAGAVAGVGGTDLPGSPPRGAPV